MTAPLKTELTRADREKVWRAVEPAWMHYAWDFVVGMWRAYPLDPRLSPGVQSVPAFGQIDGVVRRKTGFVEVPAQAVTV